MKKLRETYESFSKAMENRRIRAIVILGMYVIFFLIIFLMLNFGKSVNHNVNTNTNSNNNQIDKKANYANISSQYKYIANIEIKENNEISKFQITGKKPDIEKSEIIKKYNNDSKEYEESQKPVIINDEFFNLSTVINYVNNLDYEFSTSYKDNTILKNYLVPINLVNETISSNDNIEINVYEQNNNITKIIIDSTNYDKLRNNNIDSITYIIEYQNL